eukprot:768399-Hanusia_phi.AAC.14
MRLERDTAGWKRREEGVIGRKRGGGRGRGGEAGGSGHAMGRCPKHDELRASFGEGSFPRKCRIRHAGGVISAEDPTPLGSRQVRKRQANDGCMDRKMEGW